MAEGAGTGGSMKIYVKYKGGRVATLHVNPTDTIIVIKRRAAPVLGLAPEQQELYSVARDTTFSKDARTLGEYNINTGDTLNCRVKEGGTTAQ
jgi:hypothetical protein